ncbi:MAG: radical SAM protein [Desulfosudaceae bacterium]
MTLTINEIFHTIQGESTYAGLSCVMVRLTGCNLRCAYCDTRYAYTDGKTLALDDIMETIAGFGCPLVEITGGEPLLQPATTVLVDHLIKNRYRVLLETNGTLDISVINPACQVIMDVKCPSSGESDRHDQLNLERLRPHDQVKFVLANETDYDFARNLAGRITTLPADQILFSPVEGLLSPARLASWILRDRLGIRLQVQLHKFIWPGEEQR